MLKTLNRLEWIGAAGVTAVPFLLSTGFAGYVAIFALACLTPKAYHFRAHGLVLANLIGLIGWVWSLV